LPRQFSFLTADWQADLKKSFCNPILLSYLVLANGIVADALFATGLQAEHMK